MYVELVSFYIFLLTVGFGLDFDNIYLNNKKSCATSSVAQDIFDINIYSILDGGAAFTSVPHDLFG